MPQRTVRPSWPCLILLAVAGIGILFPAAATSSPSLWTEVGDTGGDDQFTGAQVLSSGEIAVVTVDKPAGGGPNRPSLARFDASGQLLSSQGYLVGGVDAEWVGHVHALPDGNLVFAGGLVPTGASDWTAWAFETDAAGNLLWQKTYQPPIGGGAFYDVAIGADGSLLFVAEYRTAAYPDFATQVWVVCTDAGGNVLWSKLYGPIGEYGPRGAIHRSNGDWLLLLDDQPASLLVDLDPQGNPRWQRSFTLNTFYGFGGVAETLDGGVLVAGVVAIPGSSSLYAARLDADGGVLWSKTYSPGNGLGASSGGGVLVLPDGSFLVPGGASIANGSTTKPVGLMLRLSATGELLDEQVHDIAAGAQMESLVRAADGSVYAGYTAYPDPINRRAFGLARLSGSGEIGATCPQVTQPFSLQAEDAAIVTVSTPLTATASSATATSTLAAASPLTRTMTSTCQAPQPASACTPDAMTLCLNNGRFKVTTSWTTPQGGSGSGQAVTVTPDTGYFWFFGASNVEMIVKALDGCDVNHDFWVFAGGLTDVDVTLSVTDTATGQVKTYVNPQDTPFQPIQDTGAFATCGSSTAADADTRTKSPISGPSGPRVEARRVEQPTPDLGTTCPPTGTRLCLDGGRYGVEVEWHTPDGHSGPGHAVNLTSDTGYFWFFDASNVEMVLKVLDACGINDAYWVFAGGLTNVAAQIAVTDYQTGIVHDYSNPQGVKFRPIQDTAAFATCP